MSTPRISPETHAQIVRLWTGGTRSHRKISRATGAHWQTIARVLRAEGLMGNRGDGKPSGKPGLDATPTSPTTFSRSESADSALVEYTSDERIRTLEDALKYGEVDTTVWMVDRWETSSWEVVLKVKKDGADVPLRKNLWRVKLYLKRLLPKALQDATEALFSRMADHAPAYTPAPSRPPQSSPHMLELSIFDAHFGKLAWAPETNSNYDLKIAERFYRNAVEDLIAKAVGHPIERIVFPIGNDFFNIDNLAGTTTAGTPQSSDGRFAKIIEAGEMAVIAAIEYMRNVAPVHVVWVPGNHDRMSSYYLARTVSAWFRNCPDVTVDHSPKVRKYVHYGVNLIGFTHGNNERHASLPIIMATEMPEAWAASKSREFHVGHFHRTKATETTPVNSHDGVVVRTLRSLSGTDSWTFERGYVGETKAAEAYLHSKVDGYAGHFVANAR